MRSSRAPYVLVFVWCIGMFLLWWGLSVADSKRIAAGQIKAPVSTVAGDPASPAKEGAASAKLKADVFEIARASATVGWEMRNGGASLGDVQQMFDKIEAGDTNAWWRWRAEHSYIPGKQ